MCDLNWEGVLEVEDLEMVMCVDDDLYTRELISWKR